MKNFLDKISSYNLFNYFLPGILFVFISKQFTTYNFIQQDLLIGVFLYYFIGMIISRFGSVVIEPLLKAIKFIKFVDYNKFIQASKKDDKLDLFSEINNTYRSLISMGVLLFILKLYNYLESLCTFFKEWNIFIVIILLLILLLFSYKKQIKYIKGRVESNS